MISLPTYTADGFRTNPTGGPGRLRRITPRFAFHITVNINIISQNVSVPGIRVQAFFFAPPLSARARSVNLRILREGRVAGMGCAVVEAMRMVREL
jgi:hypothetical protein